MDIEINETQLEDIINILEKDNMAMIEQVNNIYDTLVKIEKKDWNSPEKTRLDNNFIPYLKRQNDILKRILMNKTEFLKQALSSYRNTNTQLENEAKDLEVL